MTEELENYYNFVRNDTVYIHDDIDSGISKHVIPAFKKLIEHESKLCAPKIVIDIASSGGYIYIMGELLALIEAAKEEDIIVETRAMSEAHSCASILLASGTPGHRYASPMTRVLVHHAQQGNNTSTGIQLDREYNNAKHVNKVMEGLLKKYTKIPAKTLTAMLSDDCFYVYGKDLVKFGIVDEFSYEL